MVPENSKQRIKNRSEVLKTYPNYMNRSMMLTNFGCGNGWSFSMLLISFPILSREKRKEKKIKSHQFRSSVACFVTIIAFAATNI